MSNQDSTSEFGKALDLMESSSIALTRNGRI